MNTRGDVQVVDLCTVTATDLDDLWQHEMCLWRDCLRWDASGTLAALRRIAARGDLPGKAVRVDGRTVGLAYYGMAGALGVIAGLVVLPDWNRSDVGHTLLKNTIDGMRQQGVARIESRFVAVDYPWLGAVLESEGFRIYWREFLRFDLGLLRPPEPASIGVSLQPWRATHFAEAAAILHAAYAGSIEADLLTPYRSLDGCLGVLDSIVNQGSCGVLIPEASVLASDRERGLGCVVVTQVAPRQAHLPQIAVRPEYQRQGFGRGLLDYSMRQLAAGGFETLSLIVSYANSRALQLYQSLGFQTVLTFPVGIWERTRQNGPAPRSCDGGPGARPHRPEQGAGEGRGTRLAT